MWRSVSGAGLHESLDLIFCQSMAESVHVKGGRGESCCSTADWTRTDAASAWAWPIEDPDGAKGKGFLATLLCWWLD